MSLDDCKFIGRKSHDCHVLILRLFPIVIHDLVLADVCDALTKLSSFFKELCSTEMHVKNMEVFEENIVITLCKLEKIFPSCFFLNNSIEHLPIHLCYEVMVEGPVQYRWMYMFERQLLK